ILVMSPDPNFVTALKHVPPNLNERFFDGPVDIIIYSRVEYTHSLNPKQKSWSEVTIRVHRNGSKNNDQTGQESPRYDILIEGSQNNAI
ncbi:MAG: hypothetical protein P8P40_14110, partial [Sulfitobacter sp.]|nr:hypothetical protein [Sulfitobacter sp.]